MPKKVRTTVLLEPTAQIQIETEVLHALSEAMQNSNLQQIDLGLIRKSKLDKIDINGNILLLFKNHYNYLYQSINQSIIKYYYIQELRK